MARTATIVVRLFILGVGLLGVVASTLAQQLSVADVPPAIQFPEWRAVSRPEGATEFEVEFQSAYLTPYAENNQVHLRVFLPDERRGRLPVVLITHYWGATDLKVERDFAAELNKRGIAAAVMVLPYHLWRTPQGSRSGALALQPDPAKMIAMATQSVLDVRRSIDFLETRSELDTSKMGVAGTSMGAVLSALAAGIEPRITHAAYMLGGVDLAEILWRSSLIVQERDELRKAVGTVDRLRQALVSVEPLTYLKHRTPESSFVIAGRFDTVIPPSAAQELIDVLPNPKVLWIDTGHYGGFFVQQKLVREVSRFFEAEFSGRDFTAVRRLYAPSIRLGALGEVQSGLDLGIGLDVWRGTAKGDTFGTFFVTPRGPQLFLGYNVGNGFAVGGVGSPRRVGIGLLWSVVL